MSHTPRRKSAPRRVQATQPASPEPYTHDPDYEDGYDEYDEYDEYEEEPQPPPQVRSRAYAPPPTTARHAPSRGKSAQYRRDAGRYDRGRYRVPPAPRRDIFPYVMGIIVGALVVGMLAVAMLLVTSNRPSPGQPVNSAAPAGNQPGGQPAQTSLEPDRMSFDEFKALYDDPAKRPLIVDVRAKDRYDEGHIRGSVSVPLSEVGTRLAEVPKDKLVVAYCQ